MLKRRQRVRSKLGKLRLKMLGNIFNNWRGGFRTHVVKGVNNDKDS